MLPKKNGPQICQEIRENGRMVPIIMLSVRSMVEDKIELFNYGADDYVAKPFSFEELYARIRAILRRPPDVKEPIIIIGDIVIDVDKQTVTKGKKNIYLTRKEFTLFHYLAQHKNTVVSRGMIMEHVWDVASDPFSNTIEAHILNVRKKLGGAKQKLIQTIPGRGYKLNAK
jgi:DNA-binding response OmpR family regulator